MVWSVMSVMSVMSAFNWMMGQDRTGSVNSAKSVFCEKGSDSIDGKVCKVFKICVHRESSVAYRVVLLILCSVGGKDKIHGRVCIF